MPEAIVGRGLRLRLGLEGAVNTVIQTIQSGIPVARIELLDDETVDAVNRYSKLSLPRAADPVLRVPRHRGRREGAGRDGAGDRRRARRQRLRLDRPGRGAHASSGRRATTPTTPACRCGPARAVGDRRLRADLAARRVHPRDAEGHRGQSSLLRADRRPRRRRQLPPASSWSTPTTRASCDAPRRLNERLVARALAMDGTCTGEHGVGIGKIEFLVRGARRGGRVMRAIKKALDPRQHHESGQDLGTDQLTEPGAPTFLHGFRAVSATPLKRRRIVAGRVGGDC